MGDEYMHNVYRSAHRETTQWDDAQRKLGNLPPLPPEHKPEKFAPEADLTTADKVVGARTEKELEDLEVQDPPRQKRNRLTSSCSRAQSSPTTRLTTPSRSQDDVDDNRELAELR